MTIKRIQIEDIATLGEILARTIGEASFHQNESSILREESQRIKEENTRLESRIQELENAKEGGESDHDESV